MANGKQERTWIEPYPTGHVPGEPGISEIGCQVNLITGEHYGECRDSCKEEKTMSRITRDEMLKQKALLTAKRGTCTRASVGALVVKEGRTISEGYVGSPPGMPHCLDVGCFIEDGHCTSTTHAEMNALLFAARNGIATQGAEMHITHSPCPTCSKAIITAGIQRVMWSNERDDLAEAVRLLRRASIQHGAY